MAKNQNLTLNYSKLNGVCGQLKCCLQYEDEVYTQKRKKLPNEGDFVQTLTGESGKVKKLNILGEQFDILTDKGKIRRYTFDQLKKTYKNNEYDFPKRFDHISDETNTVIGLSEVEAKAAKQFEHDMEEITKKAKVFATEQILEIADFLPERDRSNDHQEEAKDLSEKQKIMIPIHEPESFAEPTIPVQETTENAIEASTHSSEKKKAPYKKRPNRNSKRKKTNKPNNSNK